MLAPVIAIARLSLRAAMRSRLVAALILALLLAVVGLPLSARGDGTLAGQVRVTLVYSLGLAAIILGAATLWAACASISQEVQERQIQLLATKPVRRFHLWLGKWLGLVAMNAFLLALAGVAVYAQIRWQTRRASEADRQVLGEELLVGNRRIEPAAPNAGAEAHRRLEEAIRQGRVPPDAPHGEAIAELRRRILAENATVGPDQTRAWSLRAPPRIRPGALVSLVYRLSAANRIRNPVSGTWIVETAAASGGFRFDVDGATSGAQRRMLPPGTIRPGEAFTVRFANGPADRSNTAVFEIDGGMAVLVAESSFEANLVRALFVLLCYLAFVAALGLAAGSVFSFPVAAYVAAAVLATAALTRMFASLGAMEPGCGHPEHGARETGASAVERLGEWLLQRIDRVVEPSVRVSPLGRLSDGLLVSWPATAGAAGLLLVLYPAVLGWGAATVLARRELALPQGSGG